MYNLVPLSVDYLRHFEAMQRLITIPSLFSFYKLDSFTSGYYYSVKRVTCFYTHSSTPFTILKFHSQIPLTEAFQSNYQQTHRNFTNDDTVRGMRWRISTNVRRCISNVNACLRSLVEAVRWNIPSRCSDNSSATCQYADVLGCLKSSRCFLPSKRSEEDVTVFLKHEAYSEALVQNEVPNRRNSKPFCGSLQSSELACRRWSNRYRAAPVLRLGLRRKLNLPSVSPHTAVRLLVMKTFSHPRSDQ